MNPDTTRLGSSGDRSKHQPAVRYCYRWGEGDGWRGAVTWAGPWRSGGLLHDCYVFDTRSNARTANDPASSAFLLLSHIRMEPEGGEIGKAVDDDGRRPRDSGVSGRAKAYMWRPPVMV